MKNKIILGLALLMGISFTGNYASSGTENIASHYIRSIISKINGGKLSEAIDMMSINSYKEFYKGSDYGAFLGYLSHFGGSTHEEFKNSAFPKLLNKIEGNEELIKKLIFMAKNERGNVIFHYRFSLVERIKKQYPAEWENVTLPGELRAKEYSMQISSKIDKGELSEAIDMMSKAEIDSFLNKYTDKQDIISYFLNFPKTFFSKLLNKIEGNEELIKKLIATAKEDAYAIFSSPGPLGEKNPLTEKIINKYPKEWYTWESVEAVAVIDDEEENVEAVAVIDDEEENVEAVADFNQ